MKTLLRHSQPFGAIVMIMCGFAVAYGMDHSRTPVVHIRALPPRNVAPGTVSLRVSTHIAAPVVKIAWDFQGDGTIDAEGADLYSEVVTFSQAGHFRPRVIVTDQKGERHEGLVNVMIDDPAGLQAILNERWKGMWMALSHGDIDKAVMFVASNQRERMRHDWTVLGDQLEEMSKLFAGPLELTDGQGYRVVAKSANPLPMGNVQLPLEVQFVWERDNQWFIKGYWKQTEREE